MNAFPIILFTGDVISRAKLLSPDNVSLINIFFLKFVTPPLFRYKFPFTNIFSITSAFPSWESIVIAQESS